MRSQIIRPSGLSHSKRRPIRIACRAARCGCHRPVQGGRLAHPRGEHRILRLGVLAAAGHLITHRHPRDPGDGRRHAVVARQRLVLARESLRSPHMGAERGEAHPADDRQRQRGQGTERDEAPLVRGRAVGVGGLAQHLTRDLPVTRGVCLRYPATIPPVVTYALRDTGSLQQFRSLLSPE
jgi:hypothetical protein